MTEDEAKTKWCPAFRGNDYGVNRPLEITAAPLGYCLGSACMAWRPGPAATDRQRWVEFGEMRVRPGDQFASSGEWVDLPAGERRGFCGLAGEGQ